MYDCSHRLIILTVIFLIFGDCLIIIIVPVHLIVLAFEPVGLVVHGARVKKMSLLTRLFFDDFHFFLHIVDEVRTVIRVGYM